MVKMKDNRAKALELVDKIMALAPEDQGLRQRALQIRDRFVLPIQEVLDRVPGRFVVDKAASVGVSRQSFYAWLHGISRPSLRQAKQLAKLTGYSVDDIRGAASGAFNPALSTPPTLARPTRRRKSNSNDLAV